MILWELRQSVNDTPNSPWREVLSLTDYITAKVVLTVILIAVCWFVVGILGLLRDWIGG